MQRISFFCLFVFLFTATEAAGGLFLMQGSSRDSQTRIFTTRGPWEIEWKSEGTSFQIYVYSESGDLVDLAVDQQGRGKGTSCRRERGRYFLQVKADDRWGIRVYAFILPEIKPDAETEEVFLRLSGSGDTKTEVFQVPYSFEIQWEFSGEMFQVYLYRMDGKLVREGGTHRCPSDRRWYQGVLSSYYLEIKADGYWDLQIVKSPFVPN